MAGELTKLFNDIYGGISDVGNSAWDNASLVAQGALEDASGDRRRENAGIATVARPDRAYEGGNAVSVGPYKDPAAGDTYDGQQADDILQVLGIPVRALDNAARAYTGDTVFGTGTDDGGDGPSVAPVRAGVSHSETAKAVTKALQQTPTSTAGPTAEQMHASNILQLAQHLKDRRSSDLQDRLQSLLGQSQSAPEDTFVARGRDVVSGDDARTTGSTGSFSRSLKPIAATSSGPAGTLSEDEATKLGLPPVIASLVSKLSSAQTPAQERAITLAAQSLPSSPEQNVAKVFQDVAAIKDPLAQKQALTLKLTAAGWSFPRIQAFLDQLNATLKPK